MNEMLYHARFDRVLKRMGGLYTYHDVMVALEKGDMQSFAVNNSWAITGVVDYPRRRVLDIICVVGDMPDMPALRDKVELYARFLKASMIRAFGRPGWYKFAAESGWKETGRMFHKDLL